MIFTNQELSAIFKMATVVAGADGNVSNEETALMAIELIRFGVSEEKSQIIMKEGLALSPAEACVIISKMTNEEKKYVTAYLGTMICADGKIEDSEMKAWALISKICNLPTMSLGDAIEILGKL
ncbi:MAG: TerB family tellurite resistance protein [Bacteroidaceae bacterium]|nr:TerB family tellurite resistance protein [Bacteroidaceae bacterium]